MDPYNEAFEEIEEDAGVMLLDAVVSMIEYVRVLEGRNAYLEQENERQLEALVRERQAAAVDADSLRQAIDKLRREVNRATFGGVA